MKYIYHSGKVVLMIVLVFLFNFPLFAQTALVKGAITDAVTKEPVAGATVSVKNTNKATSTNNYGRFFITAASPAKKRSC